MVADAGSPNIDEPTAPYTPAFDTGGFDLPRDSASSVGALAAGVGSTGEQVLVLDRDPPIEREVPEPIVIPAKPLVVSGHDQVLKRWVFVLVLAGVWAAAAAIGVGFYYWWFQSLAKTPAVFGLLLYLIACAVSGVLIAQTPSRPRITALAIAVMSAPLATTAGAAALYGAYVFGWVAP